MSRELLIHCDDVRKTYQARRTLRELVMPRHGDGDATRALDGVSFRLERGRVLGIAGESGSGKSTLANLLVGLERPTGGLIRIGDRDLARLRGADLLAFRRQVQMVFQDPFASLNPRFTVRRTVEEPLVIHGIGDRAARLARAREALEEADLRPAELFLDRFPHQLSGGQRQRAAIARAIVLRPSVLVADEPVSMLDVSVRAGILRLLRGLVERLSMSLVFITHDLSLIGQMCDDLAIMYQGRIVELGPALDVLARPLHPYTRALIAAVPVPDPDQRPGDDAAALLEATALTGIARGCRFAPRCTYAVERCEGEDPRLRLIEGTHEGACHEIERIRSAEKERSWRH
ncbi:MAG: oligopeptide ABC transporter ATP-binding protein [Acidobacteria bacterium]|nr:MAG: oligopeptide ABC transporter ATP-binding protein [Acidobacteriota bacterium]